MQPTGELQGFHGDPPVVVDVLVCDSIAIGPNGKITVQGVFDAVFANGYPTAVPGTILARIADVREPIDIRFETVAYPKGDPLGIRTLVGKAHIEPLSSDQVIANVQVTGVIAFPALEAGNCDVRVYCNGAMLGSTPIRIADPPQ